MLSSIVFLHARTVRHRHVPQLPLTRVYAALHRVRALILPEEREPELRFLHFLHRVPRHHARATAQRRYVKRARE